MSNSPVIQSRDEFFRVAQNLKREYAELDGIGMLMVQELTGKRMVAYRERIADLGLESREVDSKQAVELTAYLVTLSACDIEGKLLFTEEDIEKLSDIPFRALRTLADKIMALSGMDITAKAEATNNLKKVHASSITGLPMSSINSSMKSKNSRRRR